MPLGSFRLNGLVKRLVAAIFTRTPIPPRVWSGDDEQFHNFGRFGRSYWSSGITGVLPFEVRDLGAAQLWHTQDTTWEAWVYPTAWSASVATGQGSANVMGNAGGDGWVYNQFGFNNAGKLTFGYAYNNSFSTYAMVQESGNSGVLNQWQHIAMVQSGGNISLYRNGVRLAGPTAVIGTPGYDFGNVRGFSIGATSATYKGYLEEIRVSHTARYTGASHTVPTAQFVNDEFTKLLYHNNNTALVNPNGSYINGHDDADGTYAHTGRFVTVLPSSGGAFVSTAQSKFGGASAAFNVDTFRSLDVTNIRPFGTGDFTIEAWVYHSGVGNGRDTIIWWPKGTGSDYAGAMGIYQPTPNEVYFMNISFANGIASNTWAHIAGVRSGGTVKLYINGIERASGTNTTDFTYSGAWIGRNDAGNTWTVGHIDELRVSSVARYTSNFTPATAAFTNDADTQLLLHMNGANNSGDFLDDGPGAVTGVTAVSLVDAVTSTASTITIPAFALPNDYAILFDYSTTTTLTVPSGWTQITTSTTTGIRSTVSWRKLSSANIPTSITGMGGTTRKIMVIVRPNAPVGSIQISTPAQQATTAAPSNQTLAMSGQTMPIMGFAHYTSTGAITTRTGAGNLREFSSTTNQYVKTWTHNVTAPANQTIGQSDNGTNALQSFWIRFIP
jgi:hypothetical protein